MKKGKIVKFVGVTLLSVGVLSACGTKDDESTVKSFLSAYQQNDLKTASKYVDGSFKNMAANTNIINDKSNEDVVKAETKTFEFKDIKEVSLSGKNARVEVTVTAVDFGSASTQAVKEIMPTAMAAAFSNIGNENNSKQSQQAIQKMMADQMVKNISDPKAAKVTKTVTLTLTQDSKGKYLIKPDGNLLQSMLPNYDQLQKLFGSSGGNTSNNTSSKSKLDGELNDMLKAAGQPTVTTDSIGSKKVTYTLTNNTKDTFDYIQLNYDVFDKQDIKIDSGMSNITKVTPGQKFNLTLDIYQEGAANWKVTGISSQPN